MGVGPQYSFHSYRLVLGEIGRGLAAYCGESVYLDVGLTWVVERTATCQVAMREERGSRSGYSPRRLASHFWRMVLTSGTRPLRLVALFGALLGLGALVLTAWVLWSRLNNEVPVQGWTSVMVILLVTSGGVLFSLGILAEYLAIASKSAMGKPLYLVVTDPAEGPLGWAVEHSADTQPVGSEPTTRAEPAMPSKG
jgi:undecaprenyl-phosphate 4-deoxy-4-formamido-L-arabinose transferase